MDKNTAIMTAAMWWGEKALGGKPHRSGDKANAKAEHLMDLFGKDSKNSAPDNAIGVFVVSLVTGISEELDSAIVRGLSCIEISVDYWPCKILDKALEDAKLSSFVLPIKTWMQILKTREDQWTVRVAQGNGAGYVEIEPYEEE